MPLVQAGRNFIAQAIINDSPTFFTSLTSRLGVGASTATLTSTQTDLQSTVNTLRTTMENTYPSRATNVLTFRSLFSTLQANFTWNEWGTFNASSTVGGDMLNRKVEALGTKAGTQSWQLTATITITT